MPPFTQMTLDISWTPDTYMKLYKLHYINVFYALSYLSSATRTEVALFLNTLAVGAH